MGGGLGKKGQKEPRKEGRKHAWSSFCVSKPVPTLFTCNVLLNHPRNFGRSFSPHLTDKELGLETLCDLPKVPPLVMGRGWVHTQALIGTSLSNSEWIPLAAGN